MRPRSEPPTIELDDLSPEAVRNAFIVRFGPQCAAWLVRELDRRRKRARRRYDGIFTMHLSTKEEEPGWFQIAIGFLKRRRGWNVMTHVHRGTKRYTIKFGDWAPKKIPAALRPVND